MSWMMSCSRLRINLAYGTLRNTRTPTANSGAAASTDHDNRDSLQSRNLIQRADKEDLVSLRYFSTCEPWALFQD